MHTFKVGELDVSKRADVFVSEKLADFTRASLRALFDRLLVQINGENIKAGRKLRYGEAVNVDTSLLETEPPEIELSVIFEDTDVIVIDKPAGVLTHSKGVLNIEPTVASFLKKKITDNSLTGNRAGIVHRLDRHTSGVIIGAKNQQALRWLHKQFAQRKAKKVYVAVVIGEVDPKEAMIDVPIERNPKRPQTFRAGFSGKPAQTQYEVTKVLHTKGGVYSMVKLTPRTGRTHQLRVHMAYTGHPVIGDSIYGDDKDEPMLLHAQTLELTLPSGRPQTFSSPLPNNFKKFTKKDNER